MPDIHLLTPKGFRAAAVHGGIKTTRKPDVALLACDGPEPATAAAVFTTNKVFAAPVKVGRENLARSGGRLRGVVVNSGNANACTGKQGERDATRMCQLAADQLRADASQILPCSTGIIGHPLPMERIELGITAAGAKLGSSLQHANQFAEAILTTDSVRKTAAVQLRIAGKTTTIAGVCKGSGMIGPRMSLDADPSRGVAALAEGSVGSSLHATMLAFLTTDAAVSVPLLRNLLQQSSDRSFNAVTVDDHTSTNDTAVILASGWSGASVESTRQIQHFAEALDEVCQSLAYQIAADGEGATKVVKVCVQRATSESDARRIARAIANSPLVKCAMHGNDPNWGRIVSAAGLCGVPFDPDRATLTLQRTRVFHRGRPVPFDPKAVSEALDAPEIQVVLNCNLGDRDATVWTCDLSKRYVTINAEYHT